MVLNTQSYMWDWMGLGWDGYLLGPTLRAPYGANNSDDDNDHNDQCLDLYHICIVL